GRAPARPPPAREPLDAGPRAAAHNHGRRGGRHAGHPGGLPPGGAGDRHAGPDPGRRAGLRMTKAAGWTWDRALSGIVPPTISPLALSREIDEGAIGHLVEHVLQGGCSGLFVLGGCGEGAWLPSRQRGTVVRAFVRAAAGRVPVLAGVMLPATGPAGEAARQAAAEGADAVVVGSPYYFGVAAAAPRPHHKPVSEA